MRGLRQLLLTLGLSALLMALGWHLLGAGGLVLAAPLVAAALARPLQNLWSDGVLGTTQLATRHALGDTRHWRGHVLRLRIDGEGHWWWAVDDLRRALPALPDATRLLGAAGGRGTRGGWREPAWLRDDALREGLAAAHGHPTRQFLRWLEHAHAEEARRQARRRAPVYAVESPAERLSGRDAAGPRAGPR